MAQKGGEVGDKSYCHTNFCAQILSVIQPVWLSRWSFRSPFLHSLYLSSRYITPPWNVTKFQKSCKGHGSKIFYFLSENTCDQKHLQVSSVIYIPVWLSQKSICFCFTFFLCIPYYNFLKLNSILESFQGSWKHDMRTAKWERLWPKKHQVISSHIYSMLNLPTE